MKAITAAAARALVHGGGEVALLDVREAGQFGEGHALFAVPAPYSRLEHMVPALVPRRETPIALVDDGDGIAARAATALDRLGFSALNWIEGGMPAWAAVGHPVYKGVNVPSKLLGELAEALWHPATITAEELADWQRSGAPFRFFDARPPTEYAKMRVPGAVCLPNGELAHRLTVAAADEQEPVIVTCAGRTRGIIGAIGLKLAGRRGEVLALENGTQGWALAGHALERGNTSLPYPELSARDLADASARAAAIRERFTIPRVTAGEARSFLADTGRTTYFFDVRSEAEARDDPLPGAAWAPSGQLVQATDQWVGVRRSRIVLADDSGMRATLAAFWLKQLGYAPAVVIIDDRLRGGVAANAGNGQGFVDSTSKRKSPPLSAAPTSPPQGGRVAGGEIVPQRSPPLRGRGPEGTERGPAACSYLRIDPVSARNQVAAGTAHFVDLRASLTYRKSHVEGALWLVRPRAPEMAAAMGERAALLIADDLEMAVFAARDLQEAGIADIRIVEGGHEGLAQAGAPLVSTPDTPSDAEAIDHLFFVHDRHDGNLDASRRYLAWETGLIAQADEAELAQFRLIGPAG